ncbi:hypothetical protein Ahy_A02g008456 [Arachis hypogaea]|uniref:beta-galactosidase n=1 Tax=Arachis hypogaea TaxID=3818 RepID=A0A445EEP3_ARAHY|nr:hypothetical protein Ahy_A02g008456 [Arachis hypogaea]
MVLRDIFKCLMVGSMNFGSFQLKLAQILLALLTASVTYDHKAIVIWPELIQKVKEGGLDVIQTYVFWNGHEPSPGKFNIFAEFEIELLGSEGIVVALEVDLSLINPDMVMVDRKTVPPPNDDAPSENIKTSGSRVEKLPKAFQLR